MGSLSQQQQHSLIRWLFCMADDRRPRQEVLLSDAAETVALFGGPSKFSTVHWFHVFKRDEFRTAPQAKAQGQRCKSKSAHKVFASCANLQHPACR